MGGDYLNNLIIKLKTAKRRMNCMHNTQPTRVKKTVARSKAQK